MAFSRLTYEYTGTNLFAVNFPLSYITRDHVKARVNDEVDGSDNPVYRTLTWVTDGTVSLSGTLVNGDSVVIERTVPKDELTHDYADGEILSEENLDESFLQALMIAHEALDGRFSVLGDDIDMGNHQIKNLKDPTDDQDAVTLYYLNNFEPINTTVILAARDAALDAQSAAEGARDDILDDSGFIAVAADLAGADDIGTVADNIGDVNIVADNIVDVNAFANVYRIAAVDPTTSLDEGDLVYNTTDNMLKYYDGSTWNIIAPGLVNIVEDPTPQLGGPLDAQTELINNLADPVEAQDAATKAYVDGKATDYATAAQGAKADTAIQQADLEAYTDAVDATTGVDGDINLGGVIIKRGVVSSPGASVGTVTFGVAFPNACRQVLVTTRTDNRIFTPNTFTAADFDWACQIISSGGAGGGDFSWIAIGD